MLKTFGRGIAMLQPTLNFFARGKLLLTAEYFVLQGATALACPVKYGQSMMVCTDSISAGNPSGVLHWKAFHLDQPWFSGTIRCNDFTVEHSSDPEKAQLLSKLLQTARQLNPDFQISDGTEIYTRLEFNPQWGLGSSSTLVSNLAEWARVDPYLLNQRVFNGSGFDIACANAGSPVFYRKGFVPEPVHLNFPFADKLYLVYSGQKQNTREAISVQLPEISKYKREEISALSGQFARCRKFSHFQQLMLQHEQEVANFTGLTPVQQQYFPDFDGTIKSLGAWGGDFFLIASSLKPDKIKRYFSDKDIHTIFRWNDLIR